MANLDHIDIVVTHSCNKNCSFCIDKFRNSYSKVINLEDVDKFLKMIRDNTNEELEVLLLGGEPTTAGAFHLIEIAKLIKKYNFRPIMSTNGILKGTIKDCLPFFDWIQVTVNSKKEIDYWREFGDKINIKLAGDKYFTLEKLNEFIEYTGNDFTRRSVSMYFTPEFEELCTDKRIWDILNTLDWKRNGSYEYAFYKDIRFKKCIKGETNIIDEPLIPKLYPNGYYNKTWNNEILDNYLEGDF